MQEDKKVEAAGEGVPLPAVGEPAAREYVCRFYNCRLALTGEVRLPKAGEHFLGSNGGAARAAFDFEEDRLPILRHVGPWSKNCLSIAPLFGSGKWPPPESAQPTAEAPDAALIKELVAALDRIEAQAVCVAIATDSNELAQMLANISEIAHAAIAKVSP